jgi:hypothetical protein
LEDGALGHVGGVVEIKGLVCPSERVLGEPWVRIKHFDAWITEKSREEEALSLY